MLASNILTKMKTHHNIAKKALILGFAAWTMTSCQDWLTLYPTSQIVEENFWEDKNDLEGVRYSAYQQMRSNLQKMVLWGDLRADSYDLNDDDKTGRSSGPILWQDIKEGRLERDSTNSYFEWGGFYTAINYCNKILYHGPEILERDKQFTPSEWQQMRAEITGLRALNYFYLIRSFKDVPYTTKVINSSREVELFSATNQLNILDSLILDVECNALSDSYSLTGNYGNALARNRFGQKKDTKGLFTNAAIYALLSDMYLWRASLHQGRWNDITHAETRTVNNIPGKMGATYTFTPTTDYQACIKYGELSLAALAEQNENENRDFFSSRTLTENYGLTNCDMIKNDFENFVGGSMPKLTAYEAIFCTGNSMESIFELQFNESDKFGGNSVVTSFWGNGDYSHLKITDNALTSILYTSEDERCRDSRTWFSAWKKFEKTLNFFYCFKWSPVTVDDELPSDHLCKNIKMVKNGSNSYNNWIIYRMSDVMLQMAEAYAVLNNKTQALKYVNAIHRRWYCNDQTGEQPSASSTMGNAPWSSNAEIAVLNERQIEFMGEGKRWYDLVRYAERHAGGLDATGKNNPDPREWTTATPFANGKDGVELMVDNFLGKAFTRLKDALKSRLQNRYGLYNLIHYMEIKASKGQLEQNPVWNKTKYEQ